MGPPLRAREDMEPYLGSWIPLPRSRISLARRSHKLHRDSAIRTFRDVLTLHAAAADRTFIPFRRRRRESGDPIVDHGGNVLRADPTVKAGDAKGGTSSISE